MHYFVIDGDHGRRHYLIFRVQHDLRGTQLRAFSRGVARRSLFTDEKQDSLATLSVSPRCALLFFKHFRRGYINRSSASPTHARGLFNNKPSLSSADGGVQVDFQLIESSPQSLGIHQIHPVYANLVQSSLDIRK